MANCWPGWLGRLILNLADADQDKAPGRSWRRLIGVPVEQLCPRRTRRARIQRNRGPPGSARCPPLDLTVLLEDAAGYYAACR